MPEISMCRNEECPLKFECYRYMARPNSHYQSYAIFPVGKEKNTKRAKPYCEFFYEIDKNNPYIKLRKVT